MVRCPRLRRLEAFRREGEIVHRQGLFGLRHETGEGGIGKHRPADRLAQQEHRHQQRRGDGGNHRPA